MSLRGLLSALTLFSAVGAGTIRASQAPPSPRAPAPRAITPETAAKLSAAVPKYNPLPPAKASAEPLPDLREIDRPRNTIIRLPAFIVQERRAPYLPTEREMRTDEEQRALALKRYPGFRVGNIFGMNAGAAALMLAEEEQAAQKREHQDMVELFRYGDPETYERVKRELENAYQRAPSFGPSRTTIESPSSPFGAHGPQNERVKGR
jgi:hypothetical protein